MRSIVDIQHGKCDFIEDPFKRKWEVYDPLARVGFYDPKGGSACGWDPLHCKGLFNPNETDDKAAGETSLQVAA